MSRLFLLALLASLASGWDRPLPGPVRAAAAHERGGLNPYHFFSVRHDRRKLEGEEEGKGEGLEAEEKKEIKEWTSTLCLMALGLTFLIGHTLESIHFDLLPEAGVGILLGAALGGLTILMLSGAGETEMQHDERFDATFFFVWLIPPIIFEAGFNMNAKAGEPREHRQRSL